MIDKSGAQPTPRRRKWRRLAGFALLLGAIGGGAVAFAFRPMAAPVPRPLEAHHASMERGEYLAGIGNCAACHTTPGGAKFAGGVKFKTPFGVLYSTNITPDRQHGIGGWSYEQFHASMKHGVRPDGTHLYPALPYTSFAKLRDKDIASL